MKQLLRKYFLFGIAVVIIIALSHQAYLKFLAEKVAP